jgi:SSS family solute:Na+ symporter/sodium/pantothenate symporter
MRIEVSSDSWQVLLTFGLYLVGVAVLGVVAHRYLAKGNFVKQYFLGNRGLGPWVLAMTIAATAISGGTFMGFPSLIYSNGWIMALWIASYMLNPLLCIALMGKRLNHMARIGGSVTVPDVFRDRFNSPALGITSSLLILLFLMFNLVAQFKGGGLVMKEAMRLPVVQVGVEGVFTIEQGYLIGLIIFAFTVVAYTAYGGFWAVTWTDVLEGIVMLVGVVLMAILAVNAVPAFTNPDGTQLHGLAAATATLHNQNPALVYGPGPNHFMPLGLAFSFFVMWTMISAGQPSGMVRLMSFKDVPSMRRALLLVVGYYILTYFCLVVIFICARAIFPTQYLKDIGSEGQPDSIMPAMTRYLAHPILAGLLLAAPYAAIMSTVAAFLLMISSSLVRDLYQRVINPKVNEKTVKRLSYLVTAGVGVATMIFALKPPQFLQFIIVFTGSGQGCSFLFPMLASLYWKRATRQGVLAGMVGGFGVLFLFYVLGWVDSALKPDVVREQNAVAWANGGRSAYLVAQGVGAQTGMSAGVPLGSVTQLVSAMEMSEQQFALEPSSAASAHRGLAWIPGWGQPRPDGFAPLYAGGVDPLIWGLLASLSLTVGVSLVTKPNAELVKKYHPE